MSTAWPFRRCSKERTTSLHQRGETKHNMQTTSFKLVAVVGMLASVLTACTAPWRPGPSAQQAPALPTETQTTAPDQPAQAQAPAVTQIPPVASGLPDKSLP